MTELDAMLCSMEITSNFNSFTCHSDVINLINEGMIENVALAVVNSNLEIDLSNKCVKKRTSRRLSNVSDNNSSLVGDTVNSATNVESEVIDLTECEEVNTFKYITTRRQSGRLKHPVLQSACYDFTTEIEDQSMEVANTEDAEPNLPVRVKRSLRKRVHPLEKKVETGPKMRKLSVEQYYCNKKVKRLPSTLETIFEEPKQQNNEEQFIGTRKYKRALHFHQDAAMGSKLKLRKRILKAKKLPSSKKFLNRKKIPLATVIQKLSGVEFDNE